MKPFSEHCSAGDAADVVRGLGLAHMNAHLKDDAEARGFLQDDLPSVFAGRGIDIEVV